MNNNAKKGLKPFILKVAIIAIGICYVFGSYHSQIDTVLHVIVHQLDMPSSIIGHSSLKKSDHETNKHQHVVKVLTHNHKVLEVLNTILEASDNSHKGENKENIIQKIDKHVYIDKHHKFKNLLFTYQFKHQFLFITQNVLDGYIKKIVKPPCSI